MPTVPTELPAQARHGLARIGLDEAVLALLGAGDDFVESEKAFREGGRLGAARADEARISAAKAREDRFNAAGVRQMQRASAELEKVTRLDRTVRQEIDRAIGTPEFRERLTDARETFRDQIVAADLSGSEAEELLEIWDEAQSALEQEGFDGLLNKGRDRVKEAREARERPHRGREAHSPLPSWKYFVIAGALALGIFAVIACFAYFQCSWITSLLTFYGGSENGWLVGLIKNGCAPIPLNP